MPIYPNRNQPIQYINKLPYLIRGVFRIDEIDGNENVSVEDLKKYLGVEVAFRNQKHQNYIFCSEIKEAQYEEIE